MDRMVQEVRRWKYVGEQSEWRHFNIGRKKTLANHVGAHRLKVS